MRQTPQFKTPDAFFEYLMKKLHQGAWDSNPVRSDFSMFVYLYPQLIAPASKPSLATFFGMKATALSKAGDVVGMERLRAHIRRYFSRDLKLERREWVAAVDKLSSPHAAPPMTYIFKREGDYDERELAKLTAADQKQFLVAGSKYLGGSFRALPALFKKLRAENDGDDVDIRRWRIGVKGNRVPVYEMWTFMVDNGTVFPIGKATVVTEMIQGTFQVRKDNADLAADLQNAVPF